MNTINELLINELLYRSYAHNRRTESPERLARLYVDAEDFELRYQLEQELWPPRAP